jgi:hypothetical protein
MFCALPYGRGEQPDYVMAQMGHSDPKLALAIHSEAVSRRRERGHSLRLARVIGGAEWTPLALTAPDSVESPRP